MEKPTLVLGLGLLLAGAVASGQALVEHRYEKKLSDAIKVCAAHRPAKEEGKPWLDIQLICDTEYFYGHMQDAWVTPQLEVRDALEARDRISRWPYALALCIALLTALPWTWYFLLRRIAELRTAIAGK